uniref:Gustatory receptor n=1 Tax=Globodera rostochiensis TaxID=31243 RepID=A0A914HTC8_GLORO
MTSAASSPLLVPFIPPSDIWVGDLLFHRTNRSLKYAADGTLLIMSETFVWSDFCERLFNSFEWLLLWVVAIVLNFFILYLSLRKKRRQLNLQKAHFLLGSLAVCNALLSLGLFVYALLTNVVNDVDSFDMLLRLTRPPHPGSSLWQFVKFLVQTKLAENVFIVQQHILMLASIDRYLTLFEQYTANAKPTALFATILALTFLLALVPLDVNLMRLWVTDKTANLIRLLSMLCPLLLSLVFSGCGLIGLFQQRRLLRRVFGPFFGDELSLSLSLFTLLCVDAVAKFGIFLQLLSINFSIRITVEDAVGDAQLRAIVDIYYSLCHYLLMASPLFHALITLGCVTFYRRRICVIMGKFLGRRRKPKLDYASETMRSIIADQTRARQMRTGVWGERANGGGKRHCELTETSAKRTRTVEA